MDGARFDSLTRSFTAAGSRRAFAALAGSLGLLGLTDPDETANAKSGACKPKCNECATCKKGKCQRKNGKKSCKKRKCQPKSAGTSCSFPAGGTCQKGVCACAESEITVGGACTCAGTSTLCDGVCSNLNTDEDNCGSCGTACPQGQTCCNGSCRSLDIDPVNCGACGAVCATGTNCCAGVCRNLKTDEANCGACGAVCTATEVCQEGSCFPKAACAPTTTSYCGPAPKRCSNFADGTECFCGRSTEGNVLCITVAGTSCATTPTCTSSVDCAAGLACVESTGCCGGEKRCFARCPAPVPA